MPGWTVTSTRPLRATVSSVDLDGRSRSFGISGRPSPCSGFSVTLAQQPSVTFPDAETYSDGKVVRWDQPPTPGGGETRVPVPELICREPPRPSSDDAVSGTHRRGTGRATRRAAPEGRGRHGPAGGWRCAIVAAVAVVVQ